MKIFNKKSLVARRSGIFLVPLALVLAACSLPEPHVLDTERFDRDSSSYGQDPEDISTVTICYNSSSSTPASVVALARKACGRFRKTPVFVRQEIDDCPLLNPNAAVYNCVAAGKGP